MRERLYILLITHHSAALPVATDTAFALNCCAC
jgi:hypothetical protein